MDTPLPSPAVPVIAIPVKPFEAAKHRLAEVVDASHRRELGKALALRTVKVAALAGATPLVLAADEHVANWAAEADAEVLLDEGSTLDQAARGAVAWATARRLPWAICHADLPLLEPGEIRPALRLLEAGGAVVAPSGDGGTSLIGSSLASFDFSYGTGSFHRHLRRLADLAPLILFRRGLALDLDTPADLAAAARHRRGSWLEAYLPPATRPLPVGGPG